MKPLQLITLQYGLCRGTLRHESVTIVVYPQTAKRRTLNYCGFYYTKTMDN